MEHNLQPYFKPDSDTDYIELPMFALFPLHAQVRMDRPEWSSRIAEWWPAAILGLLALLSGAPDSNAQTLLSLL